MYTITVTNLNDSGTGTLREAIALANAYTGTDEIQILIDESLAGQSIYNEFDLPKISKSCRIIGNGISLDSWYHGLIVTAEVEIVDMSSPFIILEGNGSVQASEVTLGASSAIVLQNWSGLFDATGFITSNTSFMGYYQEPCVDLSGSIDGTLSKLPECFSGGYQSHASIRVKSNKKLTVSDGVNLQIKQGHTLYVEFGSTLDVVSTTETTVIAGYLCNVEEYGTFSMNGGVLDLAHLYVQSRGQVRLVGVDVRNDYNTVGTYSNLSITNNTFHNHIYICGYLKISGSGNIFLDDLVYRLSGYSGDTSELLSTIGSTESAVAYIGVESLANCTLAALPSELLPRGYQTLHPETEITGYTKFEDGATLGISDSHALEVSGTLEAKNAVSGIAIIGSVNSHGVNVQNGGKIQLINADIRGVEKVVVNDGGRLEMSGGMFDTRDCLDIQSGAYAELVGVEVNDVVCNYGTLNVSNCVIHSYVLLANDSELIGNGNVFVGEEVYRLDNFTGSTAAILTKLKSMDSTYLHENAYISIVPNSRNIFLGNLLLDVMPEMFPGGYKMKIKGQRGIGREEYLTVAAGGKLTFLGESDQYGNHSTLLVYGLFSAGGENKNVTTEINSDYMHPTDVYVYGGRVELMNVRYQAPTSIRKYQERGGEFLMIGGWLTRQLIVDDDSLAELRDVEIISYIGVDYGTLKLSGCQSPRIADLAAAHAEFNIGEASQFVAEDCIFVGNRMTFDSSATVRISGSDLSDTIITINGTPGDDSLIDLSGNYWGTTDMDEIWAKISGDKSRVVIDGIMLTPPPRGFTLTNQSTEWLKIADTAGQLTLKFNREIDANSVSSETLGLRRDDGSVVSIKEYIVEGKLVTLVFDTLPVGQYSLKVTNGLKDTSGNTYSMPSEFENGIIYEVYDSSAHTPPRLLLVRPNSTLTDQFSSVDLFFNQTLDAGSITIDKVHVYAASGEEMSINRFYKTVVSGKTCYRIEFDAATETGTYAVTVDASVRNEYGIEMAAPFEQNIYVASPDLQLADEISFTSATPGRYATITYTVENKGDGAAVGSWTDSIYLCRSEAWDESEAILFGRVTRSKENLASGATYSASVSGILPGLGDERYYVFVRTDEASRVSESNEQNNDRRASDPMELIVPELSVGVSLDGVTTSANEFLYYCYTAEVSGTLAFALKNADGKICVWESEGDASVSLGRVVKSENEQTLYFSAEAGQKYYISVKPNRTGQFAMELRETSFALVSVSVNSVSAGHTTTMSLVGTELTEGMNVYLEDAQGNRYDATNVVVKNPVEATVQFELPEGLEPGMSLTLHAENPGGELAVLDTPLNVATYGDVVDLSFDDMDGESFQRVGWVWRSHLNVENARGADLENAIILVTDTAEDFAMYYSYAEGSIRDRSALMFLGGAGDSSPNQLLAGEKDKLDIFVKNYRSSEGRIEAHVFAPTDTTAIAPGMWEQIASALRPATCSARAWAAWWSNMQPRIGTTVADFVSFVREMQQVSGKNTGSSLADLVDDIIRNHGGYAPSAGVWGALTDADGEGVQNAIVELYRITDGERELVSSLLTGEYGYFCFGKLEQGAQYELVCSESFMLGGNMVNSVTFVQEGVTTEQRWEMPPTASVKIAISGITGQLSEEAAVYLTSADGRMVLLTYRNDAWVADGVLPADYTLSAVEDGYTFAEKTVTVTDDSAENTFTISATKVVTLQGRLLNADGSMGVEDVCVALCQNGQVVAMAQTDESGHYVLSYIREGDYELRLDDADGRLLTEITANNEQIDDLLLNQGHTVSGSLRGAALGSTVSLYEGDVCKYTTLLKADGTYVFSGVAEGEYRLLVNDKVVYTGDLLVLSVGETSVEIPQQMVLEGVQLSGQAIGFELGYVVLYKQGNPVAVAQVGADCSFSFTVGEIGDFELQAVSAQSVESEVRQVQVTTLQDDYTVQLLPISGGVEFVNSVEMTDDAICSIVPMGNNVRGTTWLKDSDVELTNSKVALTPGDYVLLIEDNGRFIRQCFTVKSGSYARLQIGDWFDCGSLSVVVEDAAPVSDNEQMTFSVCDMGTGEVVDVFSVKKGDVVNVGNLLPGTYKVIATGVNSNVYCDEVININESETITVNLSPVEMVNYVSGYCTGGDTEFNSQIQVTLIGNDGFEISSTPVNSDGSYKVAVPIDFESGKLVFRNETTGHTTEINVSSESTEYNVSIDYREEDIFIPNESAVSDAYRLVAKRFLTARADDSYESVESQPVATAESEFAWNPIFLKVNRLRERFEGEIYDSLVTFPYVGKTDCCDASALAMMLEEQNCLHTEIEQNIKKAFNLKHEYISQGAEFLFTVVAIGLPLTIVGPQVASIVGVGTVVISMTSIIKELSKLAVDLTPENVLDTLYSVADSLLDIGEALPDVFNHPNEVKLLAESLQSLRNNVTNHENLVKRASSKLVDVDDLKDNIRAVNDLIIQDAERIKDLYNQMPALKHLFGGDNAVVELDKIITNANKNKDFISQKKKLRPRHITRHVKLFNAADSASWVRAISSSRLVSRAIPIVGAILDMIDIGKLIETFRNYEKLVEQIDEQMSLLGHIIKNASDQKENYLSCIETQGDDCKPDPDAELPHKNFQSYDPNDIYGPEGYGAQNWIGRQEMMFEVVCENIPEENIAHAAMVTIKQQIDAAYDYSTFRLGDMMIAGNYIQVDGDVQSYKARHDWTSTLGVWVDVNAVFDADTGLMTWEFVAIDPETGYVVADPFTGLLAPNYNPPEGDGGVKYYVTPKETTASGTVMQSQAEIIFDFNEPIDTPLLKYTLDGDNPVAVVQSVSESAAAGYLLVRWGGTDVGSGVKSYDVYVSVDGGEWQLWQDDISFDRALYAKLVGEHSYAFYAVAMDYAGNAEAVTEVVSAESSLVSTHTDAESSLTVNSVQAVRAGDELTLSIAFSEQAVCADWAAALLVSTSAQNMDLSTGTFRYDATTHVLTWVGTVAGVPDGAQATVRLTDGAVTDANGLPFGSSVPAYTAPIELAGVVGSTYAAPALVDYNGDGLLDVLVGEVAENGKGRIRIYLNEGTAEVASFASFIYASTEEDTPLELAATGCQGAIVRLADITGDGKDEMVVGLADGTIRIFTAAEGGYWTDSGELSCSVGGESGIVDAGTRAAIEFVDDNGDGRTDMLVGTGDGNVLLYLNTSAEGAAAFDAGRYLHDAAGRIDVGSRASVTAGDFDGDGLWDMMVGSSDGRILFYRNEGTSAEALFGRAEVINAGGKPLDMSEETNRLRLDSGDLNGDGFDDLVIGQSGGKVKVLYGSESMCQLGAVVITEKATDIISSSREVQLSAITGGECTSVDRVYDWVGGNDAVDYFHITAAAEGSYRVSVDEETLEAAVMVSVGFVDAGGSFSTQQELILAPGAALDELPGVHLNQGETLYVKVEALGSVEDAAFYELNVAGSVPSGVSGRVTLDNSADKATAAVADGRSISGWVGAGDACDYYRVTLEDSGSLSMALDELESSARLRFFRQREDGSLAQLDSRIVKGGSELERTLSLTAGTYYVEVASADGGLGCCNTTYRLTLEEEAKQRRDSSSSSPLASM